MKYDVGLTYSAARASPRTLSQGDIADICTTAGWVHDNAEAVCVVMAESSGKTDARSQNPDGNQNIGLFQIDTVNVLYGEKLLDPVYNANVARRMWRADGGFKKHWATAGQCAGKTGNVAPGGTADAVGIGGVADAIGNADLSPGGIADAILGGITGILNSIPWFRIGKGALGYFLIVGGAFAMIFIVANKAASSPVGKDAIALTGAGKAGSAVGKAVQGAVKAKK